VIDSAATKRFDFVPYYPGLDGHCNPVGLYSWNAHAYDFAKRLIEVAAEINTGIPFKGVEGL